MWLKLDLEMIQTIVVQKVIYDLLQLMDKRRWDAPYFKPLFPSRQQGVMGMEKALGHRLQPFSDGKPSIASFLALT